MIRLLVLGIVATLLFLGPSSTADAAGSCDEAATLGGVNVGCVGAPAGIPQATPVTASDDVYKTQIVCGSGAQEAVCNNPVVCDDPPGSVLYDVLRSTDGGQTFSVVSEVCLTNAPPAAAAPVVTAALVATAFRGLAWPESPLTIQPPGGRTLVNLETNFFTTNTAPTTQTVTLLGQQVDIEATPSSWTWQHGDGTSQSTEQPGAAYPALTITHTYRDADVTVSPSVDTTYTGRYRVDGGAWNPIPGTVTVAGAAGQLEVVPAAPQLVAPQ